MNITRHCKERYVQRLLNITDKQEISTYITKNDEQIIKDVTELFEKSSLVYTGKTGGDMLTDKCFYLADDVAFVVANDKSGNIITIYKLNFNLPSDVTQICIDSLLKHISDCEDEYAKTKNESESKILDLESSNEQINLEIKHMEECIKNLRNRQEINTMEQKVIKEELKNILKKQQLYAIQLFSNNYLKQEIKDGFIK